MDHETRVRAKRLIDAVKADPAIIHKQELAFLKDFVQSFTIPPASSSIDDLDGDDSDEMPELEPVEGAPPPQRFDEDPSDEDEDDDDEEEEVDPGRVTPDEDEPPKMADPNMEVTEDMMEQATPKKMEASELMSNGDLTGAIEKFTEVILLAPSALSYANRAQCYAKLKKPNAAIRDCNAALSLNENSAKGEAPARNSIICACRPVDDCRSHSPYLRT